VNYFSLEIIGSVEELVFEIKIVNQFNLSITHFVLNCMTFWVFHTY